MKTGPHAWAFLIVLSLSALGPQTWAQAVSPAALADYQAKLAQYQAARAPYEAEADAYWDASRGQAPHSQRETSRAPANRPQ
jgi:hypothetical protein